MHIDHENAKRLAQGVLNIRGISIDLEKVVTNIVIFDISGMDKDSNEICERLKEQGVLAIGFGKTIRMVTHCDVSRDDINKTVEILAESVVVSV